MNVNADLMASMSRTVAREKAETKPATSSTTAEGAEAGAAEQTDSGTPEPEGGEAGAGEKDESGSETPGSQDTESQDTTAEAGASEGTAEEEAPEEATEAEGEKPEDKTEADKWDEEEQKVLKTWLDKEADKFKASPVTRKLLKIARDNQAEVQTLKQQAATLSDNLGQMGRLVLDHDYEEFQKLAEELGGEKWPLDVRTHEEKAKEVADRYNKVFDTLQGAFKEDAAAWEHVLKALKPLESEAMSQIQKLRDDGTVRRAEEAARKAAGKPGRGGLAKELEGKATQNFTDLKAKDKEAQDRFDALKPYFTAGVLKDKNRVYASNAKLVDELGSAVEFKANFQKKYLPKIRKAIEDELKARGAIKAPPSGRKESDAGGARPASSKNGKNFNHYAAANIMDRIR